MKAARLFIISTAMVGLIMSGPALAQGWVRLGDREVNDRVDRDVITVGGRARYRQIRLCVVRNPIRVYDMDVRFGNGGNQDVPVRAMLRDGQCTRVIRLAGRTGRDIASVRITYEAASLGAGRSHVTLYGR